MKQPEWFRSLPTWARVIGGLLGLLVVMTGLSMVLGVVFAGIALGLEFGSVTLGLLAAVVGLVLVLVPTAALVMIRTGDDRGVDAGDEVETLKERYLAGEIDEATFERRVTELLTAADASQESAATDFDGRDVERMPKRERQ
ncbi:SHOCT domain-containing protein [Natronosalvus vescus]|uniref:SHOCT domain-containing protein n=1 Tax=Natronosalvus vescus TaxID=2953881 RepID=UPI002090CE85|nr:SHOCT domain-containing protein [Natronosalvus vescus]